MAELLERAASVIRGICPDAEICLFGSRARGTADLDSDWDLLVLLPELAGKAALRDALLDLELQSGQVISPLILSRETWSSLQGHPLQREVLRHGVPL